LSESLDRGSAHRKTSAHTEYQTQKNADRRGVSLPGARFEPTIPMFDLNRAGTNSVLSIFVDG